MSTKPAKLYMWRNGCYGNFSGKASERKNVIRARRKRERQARKDARR